jgi:hypothetical protein
MNYTIVIEDSAGDLAETVNEYITEGWRPQGGAAVMYNFITGLVWAQALVKDGE